MGRCSIRLPVIEEAELCRDSDQNYVPYLNTPALGRT